MVPLERYWQKSIGKHFRQTPIEPTRQTLAKRNIWVQSRQTLTGSSRQTLAERNGGNQFRQTQIKPIRQTLARKDIGLIQLDTKWSLQTDIGKRRWETLQADTN